MNYAVLHPQYVSKLVLIGSAPPSYKIWNVLFDNQYVRRSVAELDSMNALIKIFSLKTDRELDSLKRVDPFSKEVVAFKSFIAITFGLCIMIAINYPGGFDELFTNFNFQPIPFIDKEVTETKWDIMADLKKLHIPALIIYGRQDDQDESTFFCKKNVLKTAKCM